MRGSPYAGTYAATKAGVVSLTQTRRPRAAGPRVTGQRLCPAFIDMPMAKRFTPMVAPILQTVFGLSLERILRNIQDRMGTTREVAADAVAYLASDQAPFISGIAFPVDNGLTAGAI